MAKGTTIRMWRRTAFLLAILIIGFAVVVGSLFRLQLVQGEEMQTRAVDQYLKDTSISAKRGTIYDCAMRDAEDAYFALLDEGCTPQEARSVLPNSLKNGGGHDGQHS